ncbi:hypothetical protein L3Q82_019224 [Scortum barcoo]|uniref:Uncharacterized protein n=1 Tax=Scortum barcoo TaxID=214431 RepID=A0ACB8VDM2_9TELE|nr:hypothetical protein L3Q82_019224 [Scortum barcoo]
MFPPCVYSYCCLALTLGQWSVLFFGHQRGRVLKAAMDFHSQIASIMEVLANAAVAEICKVVDDGYAVVHLEMSRSQKENEFLRRKIKLLELQVARYRAERVKGAEGSISSRLPGVRLLNRQNRDSPAGPSLQSRTRFLNRGPGAQLSVQKTQPIILDQDPDQDVVTTTKTESAEPEEEGELLIVKVEGAIETETTNHELPGDADTAASKGTSDGRLARRHSETEVSGSDIDTFVVGRTAETDSSSSDTTHSSQLEQTGSDVRAGDNELLNSEANMTPHRDGAPASCDNEMDDRKDNEAELDTSKSSYEVIVIDGGGMSDKEGEEWSDVDQTKGKAGRRRDRHEETTLAMIRCAGMESAALKSVQVKSSLQAGSALPLDDTPGTSSGGTTSSINSSSETHGVALHCPVNHHKSSSSSFRLAFYHAVTMERPYGCTSCTKRFFLESDLQKHMARHTREKPYACLLCGKSFVCQSQLDIHRNQPEEAPEDSALNTKTRGLIYKNDQGCLKNMSSPQRKEEKMDEVQGDTRGTCNPSLTLLEWQESSKTEDKKRPFSSTYTRENIAGHTSSVASSFLSVSERHQCDIDRANAASKLDIIVINSLPRAAEDKSSGALLSGQGGNEKMVTPLIGQDNINNISVRSEYNPLLCIQIKEPPSEVMCDDNAAYSNCVSIIDNPPVAMGTVNSQQQQTQHSWSGIRQMDNAHFSSQNHPASSSQNQESGSAQSQQQQHCLPYACTFCSRRYAHQCQLRIHERVHTGEKPYQCVQCGKSFGQVCSLKRHQMVHTGERPFPCPHCGKQFSTSTNLKVHQSVHTGEKRFHCSKCGKNFSFLSNLIRHQALHTTK